MTKSEKNRATRRTIPGFLSRTYTKMKARVTGRDGRRSKRTGYWDGLPICTREEFIEWSNKQLVFKVLFAKWSQGGYRLKDCPTVDRIDPKEGYVLGNMQWVTQSENARKARRTIDGRCY